ncbi:solute carrier organic anion transporter [Candidatus Woesearchaeota archaeon]|nr:solute carrier organic anion transporter [Candidatus Woesearchaeota archaeon]
MIKKRFTLIGILLYFLIGLLLIPLVFSVINIVVDQNRVKITAIYEGDVGLEKANITDLIGDQLFYIYPTNITVQKIYQSGNTTLRFGGTGCPLGYSPLGMPYRPCFILNPGDYTFSVSGRTAFGTVRIDKEDFTVDLTPCDNDGIVEPPEECDGYNLSNTNCSTYTDPNTGKQPFGGGTLSCYDCSFDVSGCLVCEPNHCSICDNQICSGNGKQWTTINYTWMCGPKDSNLGTLGTSCTPGVCDVFAGMVCDSNGFWTSTGFCTYCSDEDSSCYGSCTPGNCDISAKAFCDQGSWVTPLTNDYCAVCGNYDSECLGGCSGSACDTKNNKYCSSGSWVSPSSLNDYCQRCGQVDADCGIPICIDGTCDICNDAKKYCNNGVWESQNYCDYSRCGSYDSWCNRSCQHGTCDTVAHKYCRYNLWESDWDTYCNNCKSQDSSLYCLNPEDCGNGVIDRWNVSGFWVGEACDKKGPNLNGASCLTWPQFVGGTLGCADNCLSFDRSSCILRNESCGDDIIQGDDMCDGDDLGGKDCTDPIFNFMGGTLGCTNDCKYDTSNCIPFPECGDAVANQDSEDCDKDDLRGETCESLGYAGGSLKCDNDCSYDKSGCYGGVKVCGDGVVQKPNDAGFNEQCDMADLNNMDCKDFDGYTGGTLVCNGDCTYDYTGCSGGTFKCSDRVKNQESEDCDYLDLGGETCESLGYDNGTLECFSDCTFDKSRCYFNPGSKVCGDGTVQQPNDAGFNEQCDVADLDGAKCKDKDDFTGGLLTCHGDCTFNYDMCTGDSGAVCGNNILEPGEHCDGDVEDDDCTSIGKKNFIGGTLSCSDNCEFDTSDCIVNITPPVCGDGIVNGYEGCDGTNLAGLTCGYFTQYVSGTLKCNQNCTLDFSNCLKQGQTAAHCENNVTDEDETDLNCGGLSCPGCPNGKRCLNHSDCISNYCLSNICTEASCSDTIKNGLETDVDCGANCPCCGLDMSCNINSDCCGLFCHPDTRKCDVPSCDDGYKNGEETDIDCGDGCPEKCEVGQGCVSPNDCKSGYCDLGVCAVNPTLDTDMDGMPDKWELKYGLDPNNPDDANQDMDGDGYSNLDEYLDGTDPTDPNDPLPKKKHTLQIIFLIIGLLLMLGSIGFLVYSRMVLVPQQRAATRKAQPQRPMPMAQRRPLVGRGQPRPGRRMPLARRGLTQRQASRKSLLKGFEKEDKTKALGVKRPEAKPFEKKPVKPVQPTKKVAKKPAAKPAPAEEFIPLSELGAKQKPKEEKKEAPKKPLGGAFEKLRELSGAQKKKDVNKESKQAEEEAGKETGKETGKEAKKAEPKKEEADK